MTTEGSTFVPLSTSQSAAPDDNTMILQRPLFICLSQSPRLIFQSTPTVVIVQFAMANFTACIFPTICPPNLWKFVISEN